MHTITNPVSNLVNLKMAGTPHACRVVGVTPHEIKMMRTLHMSDGAAQTQIAGLQKMLERLSS